MKMIKAKEGRKEARNDSKATLSPIKDTKKSNPLILDNDSNIVLLL